MSKFVISAVVGMMAALSVSAVDPAPLPKELREAKTVYIVNQGAEDSILDHVYDRLSKWSRWSVTTEREKADVIVVLSAQNYFYGMMPIGTTTTGTATATSYGNTTVVQGSSTTQSMAVPMASYPRYLTLVDPKNGAALLSISCELRIPQSYTAKVLVDRLKKRFPKSER